MQRTVFQQKNRVIELLVVHNKNRWRSGTWGSAVSSKSMAFATSAFTWEGARLHLHPMDLNYNPGVSFCIPIMKTNMSVFDLDSVIMRCFLDLIQSEGSDVRHKAACSSVANFCFSGIYIYIYIKQNVSRWVFYKFHFMVYSFCSCDWFWEERSY